MTTKTPLLLAAVVLLFSIVAPAQSATDLAAFNGLAPVSALQNTTAGQAALAANYAVTGGIQTGKLRQPTLLPLAEQRQQALRDAAITGGDLAQLADGLGTALGAAYLAKAHYKDSSHFTNISPAVASLIAYANASTGGNSNAAKFFFANATSNGKIPVSDQARTILQRVHGVTDVFGKSYGFPAGSTGANPYGNSRPFQTEPTTATITGLDYFNVPTENTAYNRGPMMNLVASPSFPSGHTTYGYTGALLLAILVPERYQQMVARGAEYGNDRILMGSHYAMDVLAGRTLALYGLAHLLANDPAYVGQRLYGGTTPIMDFPAAIQRARADMAAALEAGCARSVQKCAREDKSRFKKPAADQTFYAVTQTYDLPVVFPQTAQSVEQVGVLAPEAGNLLTAAFPSLTLDQADQILTDTEGPGGGFLDNGSGFGVYSRLNLYAAAGKAAALAAATHSSAR